MDRPQAKMQPLLRVCAVVFALLMIGGYAVLAQMRAQRVVASAGPDVSAPALSMEGGPGGAIIGPDGFAISIDIPGGVPGPPVRFGGITFNPPQTLPPLNLTRDTVAPSSKLAVLEFPRLVEAKPHPNRTRAPTPARSNLVLSGLKTYAGASLIQDLLTSPPEPAKKLGLDHPEVFTVMSGSKSLTTSFPEAARFITLGLKMRVPADPPRQVSTQLTLGADATNPVGLEFWAPPPPQPTTPLPSTPGQPAGRDVPSYVLSPFLLAPLP